MIYRSDRECLDIREKGYIKNRTKSGIEMNYDVGTMCLAYNQPCFIYLFFVVVQFQQLILNICCTFFVL